MLADARHLLVEVLLLVTELLVLFPVLGHLGHINVLLHVGTVHLEHLEVLGLHVVLGIHATHLLPHNFTLIKVSNEVRSRGLILDLLLLDCNLVQNLGRLLPEVQAHLAEPLELVITRPVHYGGSWPPKCRVELSHHVHC